jgi:hypothetical protein
MDLKGGGTQVCGELEDCSAPVVHTYNSNYLGGQNQEGHGLRSAYAISSQDSILKIPNTKKGWWSGSSGRVPPYPSLRC